MKQPKENQKFNLRSFTSFSLVISTLIMSISGFILYVAPPGRIANWGTWKLLLFTKTEWQALHTIFSYLFFILIIIHLFFVNWKTFLTYFKSKIKAGLNKKWELIWATVICAVIFIGTLKTWIPFSSVMSFGEKVKESWEKNVEVPPALHMEIYSLEKLSPMLDSIPASELLETLKSNNIKVTGVDMTLKEIAEENKMTPSEIYGILTTKYKKTNKPVTGEVPQGIGKFTIKSTSQSTGKDIQTMIGFLKTKGIEATEDTPLRTIGEQLGISPREVYSMLKECK